MAYTMIIFFQLFLCSVISYWAGNVSKKLQLSKFIVYAIAYTCTNPRFSLFQISGKLFFANISTFKMRTKKWPKEVKRAAFELWRAGVKQTDNVARLSMPLRTVQRLIPADRRNAASRGVTVVVPTRKQKEGTHNRKVFPNALAKMKKLLEY